MKTLATFLFGAGLLACSAPGNAQDESRLQADPTYSTRNYKQPNKAATARTWEERGSVRVQAPAQSGAGFASYKNQSPAQQPVGGVVVRHTPNENLANRNYKVQPTQPAQESGRLSQKRDTKPRNGATVGE